MAELPLEESWKPEDIRTYANDSLKRAISFINSVEYWASRRQVSLCLGSEKFEELIEQIRTTERMLSEAI